MRPIDPLLAAQEALVASQPWRERAACLQKPFMVDDENPASVVAAKEVCAGCRVRLDCLAQAVIDSEPAGVWGGTDPEDRDRMRAELAVAAHAASTGETTEPLAPSDTAAVAEDQRMLTVAEIAERLNVDRVTVHRWVTSGALTALRVQVGRRALVRVPSASLEAFLARNLATASVSEDTAELLAWLTRRAADIDPGICPRCAARSIEANSKFGWCAVCTTEAQVAADEANEREKARKRRWWNENGPAWREQRRIASRQAEDETADDVEVANA